MKLANALNEKRMDVRIVDRLIAEGKVTKEEVDKYFAELADDAGNFEKVQDKEPTATESTEL